MAGNLKAIREALAAQLGELTGLDARPYVPNSVTPPMLAVKSADSKYVDYGITIDGVQEYNFQIMILMSYASDTEDAQAAVDDLVDGATQENGMMTVPAAIEHDPTLGGVCHFVVAQDVAQVALVSISGQQYFCARVNVLASR